VSIVYLDGKLDKRATAHRGRAAEKPGFVSFADVLRMQEMLPQCFCGTQQNANYQSAAGPAHSKVCQKCTYQLGFYLN
jgi:hypothetical protein